MNAEELLEALQKKERVVWPEAREWAEGCRFYLILEKNARGPVAGSLTFSELRRGLDQPLRKYVLNLEKDWRKYIGKIRPLPAPWIVRIQLSREENGSWDWVWTGGETMDLVGEKASRMSECCIVGIGVSGSEHSGEKETGGN